MKHNILSIHSGCVAVVRIYLNSKIWWNHLEKQGKKPSHSPSFFSWAKQDLKASSDYCGKNNKSVRVCVAYFDLFSGWPSLRSRQKHLFFCSFSDFFVHFSHEITEKGWKWTKKSWKRLKISSSTSFWVRAAPKSWSK